MRVKVISALVVVLSWLSLVPMLMPRMATPVNANPMETLHLDLTTTFSGGPPPINSRVLVGTASGDEIVQFTRPNLILGEGSSVWMSTTTEGDSTAVSGDLIGSIRSDMQTLEASWTALPSGTSKGYIVGKFTFDDAGGNSFGGVFVADTDIAWVAPVRYETTSGYLVSTWAAGGFSGQMLIGSMSTSGTYDSSTGNGTTTGTITLRRYSSAEVSGPVRVSGTSTGTGPIPTFRSLGSSYGSQPDDEYVQFSRTDITMPLSTSAIYIPEEITSMTLTGGMNGTSVGLAGNSMWLHDTVPQDQGWMVSVSMFQGVSGGFKAVSLNDGLGLTTEPYTHTFHGYMFSIGNATGTYAGKDYYGVFDSTSDWTTGGEVSISGDVYTMTPGGGIPTATGTGLATLVPDSGSMENLAAVSEVTMPSDGKPDILFPHGFFEFQITGLAPAESVTLTITLPYAVPTTASYWKYGPTPSDSNPHWYQIPMGDNDGDNVITITLADGGWGDDDLDPANGVIVDQGGPGWPGGGGGSSAPVFPSVYVGIAAALGAGIIAYFVHRRMTSQKQQY